MFSAAAPRPAAGAGRARRRPCGPRSRRGAAAAARPAARPARAAAPTRPSRCPRPPATAASPSSRGSLQRKQNKGQVRAGFANLFIKLDKLESRC